MKDEIRSMKSDICIAALSQGVPTDVVGEEIMFLKRELASLQDMVSVFSSQHLENVHCHVDPSAAQYGHAKCSFYK